MNRTVLFRELREKQERFVALCYRFQDLRVTCAILDADVKSERHFGDSSILNYDALSFPIYTFVRTSDGALRMIRQAPIRGGSGTTLLHCWIETIPEAVVVHVEGEVDISTAPWLADTIANAFQQGRGVIVDLSDVNYLDGSGLAVLQRAAESHLTHLAVTGSSPQVRRLFDIVHLNDVIPLVGSLEAGREYLRHCN